MAFVRFFVSTCVCVAEKLGPIVSLQRSFHLTRGSAWRIFGLLAIVVAAVVLLALIAVAVVFGVAGSLPAVSDGSPSVSVAVVLLFLVALPLQFLLNAFVVVLATTTYIDLRRASEGFTPDDIARIFE